MRILKSIVIAFSIYSKIPVPQFEWKEEDMKYMLCFFPWVGIVIGVCIYFWRELSVRLEIGESCYTLIGVAIPLLVTGGFHVDGFMDTMDALHSYQPKEKKLEILKDSHIGAFAAIMLVLYGLIYIGAFSEIREKHLLKIVCAGFVLARCLCGISVVSFPPAKKSGLLYLFAGSAQKTNVKVLLYGQGAVCMGYMLWQSLYAGIIVIAAALVTFVYYYYRCKKEFGGFTGDTAGYFILICEGSMMVAAAILNILT
ncbi:adenosylcobinamide-GDP ribazoletransferase [Defluviitalea saccharophila]|uniref:Adenosylcobinamide-GDP ribazoletransferase n=1 Tax=Defluviitalea saccharophila TaxID=879970 RepID=A0ABZ2Y2V2_9FIRM